MEKADTELQCASTGGYENKTPITTQFLRLMMIMKNGSHSILMAS